MHQKRNTGTSDRDIFLQMFFVLGLKKDFIKKKKEKYINKFKKCQSQSQKKKGFLWPVNFPNIKRSSAPQKGIAVMSEVDRERWWSDAVGGSVQGAAPASLTLITTRTWTAIQSAGSALAYERRHKQWMWIWKDNSKCKALRFCLSLSVWVIMACLGVERHTACRNAFNSGAALFSALLPDGYEVQYLFIYLFSLLFLHICFCLFDHT